MREILSRLALAIVAFAVTLVVAEVGLRSSGFYFDAFLEEIEFGFPRPDQIDTRFLRDPDLFWVNENYYSELSDLRGEERRPDLICLGDSVTQRARGYCHIVAKDLRVTSPDFTSYAHGASGWSSYQGLQQFKRDLASLRPRIITVFFGWNDHWFGYGIPDQELHELLRSPFLRFRNLRVVQVLLKARVSMLNKSEVRPNRVPEEAFRNNLREFIRVAREHGIIPMLLTAPSSHERGNEPGYLALRSLRQIDDLIPMHQSYVAIVREVAQSEGAALCDLESGFSSLPRDVLLGTLFEDDGIHLHWAGHRRIADLLTQCFRDDPEIAPLLLTGE